MVEPGYSKLRAEPPRAGISLATACKRAGYVFDLWQEDPEELVSILERAWSLRDERHPLGLLFEHPLPPSEMSTHSDAKAVRKIRRSYRFGSSQGGVEFSAAKSLNSVAGSERPYDIGDVVKARLSADMKRLDEGGEKYIDASREWYHAIIKAINDDGTYTIDWEHGYAEDRNKTPADLMHLFTNTHTDGVRALLMKCRSKVILWREIPVLLFLFVFVATLPELIFMLTTHRNICSEAHENAGKLSEFCDAAHESRLLAPAIDHFMGALLGCGSIAFVMFLGFVIFPCWYCVLNRVSPKRAKGAQKFITLLIDSVHQGLLSNVYGTLRIRLLVALGASYLLSCLALSIILLAPGVIPLGFVTTQLTLRLMNSTFGDEVGLKSIQQCRILTILEKLSKRFGIDLKSEDLRDELIDFFATPNDAGTIQISLPLITLFSCVTDSEEAYSKRISRVLVAKSYAAFTHPPKTLAQLKAHHDIIVDVFKETCKVPGVNLLGERWHKEGQKLPWHLSIDRQVMQLYEEELQQMGVASGDCCFTWRSPRNGHWMTRENNNPARRIEDAKGLMKIQHGYDVTLNDLMLDSSLEDTPKLTCALLKAGANPNFRTEASLPKSSTLLRACSAGKIESIRMLITFKADVSEAHGILSAVRALETVHFNPIRDEVLELFHEASNLGGSVPLLVKKDRMSLDSMTDNDDVSDAPSSESEEMKRLYGAEGKNEADDEGGDVQWTTQKSFANNRSRTSFLREHGTTDANDWKPCDSGKILNKRLSGSESTLQK